MKNVLNIMLIGVLLCALIMVHDLAKIQPQMSGWFILVALMGLFLGIKIHEENK